MRGSAFVGVASGVVPALAAAAIVAGQAGQGSDGAPAGATPTSSTVVRIAPAEQSVTVGDGVQVDVLVDDVSGLGAYEFRIAYDPGVLSFAAVENGPFLGSTGRSVACLPPLLDVGTVRYGCLTLGPEPEPPSGSGRLATLTLGTSCAGTSSLQFELASVVDVLGNHIPRTTSGGTVTVIDGPVCPPAGPPGDGDCSGLVDSVDAALALQFEAGVAGSLPCQALADLSGDAQVTALDAALVLQIVAGLL